MLYKCKMCGGDLWPQSQATVVQCESCDSVMEDEDFGMVMDYADGESRPVYRRQAKDIDGILQGIAEVCRQEEPPICGQRRCMTPVGKRQS